MAFTFTSLASSYFYLRAVNNEGLWRPHSVTAPTGLAAAIFAVVVAAVVLNLFGTSRMRRGSVVDWEVSGWVALAGLLLAVALQILELTEAPFYPGSSGYASCFIGWSVLNCGLLLGCSYWLETILARSLRLRRAAAEDGVAARSSLPGARLLRANVSSCGSFLVFTVPVELLFWLMFSVL